MYHMLSTIQQIEGTISQQPTESNPADFNLGLEDKSKSWSSSRDSTFLQWKRWTAIHGRRGHSGLDLDFFFSYVCHEPYLVSHETTSSSTECSRDEAAIQFCQGTGFDNVRHHLGLATRTQISVCKSPFPSAGTALSLFSAKTAYTREVETRLPDCGVTVTH